MPDVRDQYFNVYLPVTTSIAGTTARQSRSTLGVVLLLRDSNTNISCEVIGVGNQDVGLLKSWTLLVGKNLFEGIYHEYYANFIPYARARPHCNFGTVNCRTWITPKSHAIMSSMQYYPEDIIACPPDGFAYAIVSARTLLQLTHFDIF